MSNLYNMTVRTNINDIPVVAWKGKTFSQITSIITQNTPASMTSAQSKGLIFNPLPLKLYRREIAANINTSYSSNRRTSLKIDELDRPNGSLVYNSTSATLPTSCVGVNSTLDITIPNDKSQLPGSLANCNTTTNTMGEHAFTPTQNALRRVRSSGMTSAKFNSVTNKAVYYSDSRQYLTSRSKTADQNKYNYLRTGDAAAEPGTNAASSNTYYANGTLGGCATRAPVYYKPSNSKFAQDGGVSSSEVLLRLKYNTINSIAAKSASNANLGHAAANAMAYGVVNQPYTIKDKIGFPNTCSPVINPITGELRTKTCSA